MYANMVRTLQLCLFQAFKQHIYGRKYVWVLPGWYSEKWWENTGDTSCTKHEVKKAAGNYLATRPLPLGGSSISTIAGKVGNFCCQPYMMQLSSRSNQESLSLLFKIQNLFHSFAVAFLFSSRTGELFQVINSEQGLSFFYFVSHIEAW